MILFREKIAVPSRYLNADLHDHIYNCIKNKFQDKCFEKEGYIISIDRDISVISNSISSDNVAVFDVEFKVETFLPEVGQVLDGQVCMVFPGGIFLRSGKMKMIVPVNKLDSYTYDSLNKRYVSKDKSKNNVIQDQDLLKVKIDMLRFDKNRFDCIVSLVT